MKREMRSDQAEDEKLDAPANARDRYQARKRAALDPSDATACSAVVGHWTPVADSMPDDKITVLVWVESLDDATLAYHDADIKERRGDSGWIMARTSRVLLGVTHWCQQINPPNADVLARGESATPTTLKPH
jgi:hypothetical protein